MSVLTILQAATEYVVRVSFGTALIASIVLVSVTIIAILSSSRRCPYFCLISFQYLKKIITVLFFLSKSEVL